MVHLTSNYWSEFKQDGLLFEDLVKDILELEYPGYSFKHTQRTHDGSRDFELSIPELNDVSADIWFECKFHKDALPIHDVSMTLIMAYIESVRQIIFFSYSPIKSTFNEYIARFKERARIPVFIYDDIGLEELIFKHWNKLNTEKYFPKYLSSISPVFICNPLLIDYMVYKNNHKINCKVAKDKSPVFRYNDDIAIRIVLSNPNTSKNISVKIKIDNKELSNYKLYNKDLLKNNNEKHIDVKHNSSSAYTIFLRIKKFNTTMNLPQIEISYLDISRKIKTGNIRGQWLAETALIGQTPIHIVQEQLKLMNSSVLSLTQIYGHSGVGKSRILKEVISQARMSNKEVLYYDADTKKMNLREFVRNIISIIEGLPLVNKKVVFLHHGSNIKNNEAVQMLYNDKYIDSCSLPYITDILLEELQKKAIWILLDNVQMMDTNILLLLDALLNRLSGNNSDSGILIAFNIDYIFSGSYADMLNKKISAFSSKRPDFIQSYNVSVFSKKEALLYMKDCLTFHPSTNSFDSIEYIETLEYIIDKCGTQQFYLQNLLLFLYQRGVIERTQSTSFYINDIAVFKDCLDNIPVNVMNLLELRINKILEYFNNENDKKTCIDLCSLLTVSCTLSSRLYKKIFIKDIYKRYLFEFGIILIQENGDISFYHQYFEKYFRFRIPLDTISPNMLNKYISAIEDCKLLNAVIYPYFIAKYLVNKVEDELATKIMKHIIHHNIPPRYSNKVMIFVAEILENRHELFPKEMVAKAFSKICFTTANIEGINKACAVYEKLYLMYVDNIDVYSKYSDIIFHAIREYFLSLNNLNKNRIALEKASVMEGLLKNKKHIYYINEFKCIANYAMGNTNSALISITNALKFSEVGSRTYICALRELGNLYYYSNTAYTEKNKIASYYKQALDMYISNKQKLIVDNENLNNQIIIATYINAAMADMIEINICGAHKKIAIIEKYIGKTDMPFYEIKMCLLKAFYLFWKDIYTCNEVKSYDEIIYFINKAIDECVVYYNMQDYPVCFHLKAVVQLYKGLFELSYDNYIKACTVLQNSLYSNEEERIWEYFYEDMAIRLRIQKKVFPKELIIGIRNPELRNMVSNIINCKQDELEQMLNTHCSQTALVLPDKRWNMPKI